MSVAFPYLNATTATDDDIYQLLLTHSTALDTVTSDLSGAISSTTLLREGLDASWILMDAYFVFLMTIGFSLLEAGSVKAMNAKNVIMQCSLVTCVSIMCFWFYGYGMAEGTSIGFGSMQQAVISTLTKFPPFIFLWGFSNTTGLIVAGSVTSRINMVAFITLTVTICSIVFPMVAFWVWSTGWLSVHTAGALHVIDFAGGLPVHTVGGFAALTAAFIVGPRYDRFVFNRETGTMDDRKEPGHSIVFAIIGIFLMWFAWFGYNSGATYGLVDGRVIIAGHAAVNTLIAAGVASLTITGYHMLFDEIHNLWELLNGILCGLVAITPAAATVDPYMSIIIGMTCVLAYRGGVRFLEWMRVDDVVEAFAVHGCCGMWGVICTALLSKQEHIDLLYGADVLVLNRGRQLGVHLLAIIVVALFTVVCTALPLLFLRRFFSIRVSVDDERVGLDATHHGGYAYPDFKAKMLTHKNQALLEAELGAAVKSVGADDSRSSGKLEVVTEKIRQLDEMRKAQRGGLGVAGLNSAMESSQTGLTSQNGKSKRAVGSTTGAARGILRNSGRYGDGTTNASPGPTEGPARKYLSHGSSGTTDSRTAPTAAWSYEDPTTKQRKMTGVSSSAELHQLRGERPSLFSGVNNDGSIIHEDDGVIGTATSSDGDTVRLRVMVENDVGVISPYGSGGGGGGGSGMLSTIHSPAASPTNQGALIDDHDHPFSPSPNPDRDGEAMGDEDVDGPEPQHESHSDEEPQLRPYEPAD